MSFALLKPVGQLKYLVFKSNLEREKKPLSGLTLPKYCTLLNPPCADYIIHQELLSQSWQNFEVSVCDLIYLPTCAVDCKIRYDQRLQIISIFFTDWGATVYKTSEHCEHCPLWYPKAQGDFLNVKIKEANTHIWEPEKWLNVYCTHSVQQQTSYLSSITSECRINVYSVI